MSNNTNAKILLVDDENDVIHVMIQGLQKIGFTVDAFSDPTEALAQFKPKHYDHIVLDVRMPKMIGFELARAIWAKDETTSVCFLSAFDIYKNEAQIVFKDFKSTCFVTKLILPSKLAEHISQHLTSNS